MIRRLRSSAVSLRLISVLNLVLVAASSGPAWAGINEWTPLGPYSLYYTAFRAVTVDRRDSRVVYAVGGSFWKSVDGGSNWSVFGGGSGEYLRIDPQNSDRIYFGLTKSTNGGNTWSRIILPDVPGWVPRALDLAIDPQNPNMLYLATWGAGIFKSTDGGQSWLASNTGLPTPYLRTLAIDPRSPNIIYAGAGHTDAGAKLFKSTDAGASWSAAAAGLPANQPLHTLVIDPQNPNTLYVSAMNSSAGTVFKTTNGGANWSSLGQPGRRPNTAYGLAISPQDSNRIYAVGDGVWRSIDAGANWVQTNPNFAGDYVTVDPWSADTAYVLTYSFREPLTSGNLVKTSDGGRTWSSPTLPQYQIAMGADSVAADPNNSGVLFAFAGGGVQKTGNGGTSWERVGAEHYIWGRLHMDAHRPSTLYAPGFSGAGDLQVASSPDGGSTWRAGRLTSLPDASIAKLASDPTRPGVVFAGINITDRLPTVFRSSNGGQSWFESMSGLGAGVSLTGYLTGLAVDRQSRIFVSFADAEFQTSGLFVSSNGGSSWTLAREFAYAIGDIAVDPNNAGFFYLVVYPGVDAAGEMDYSHPGVARIISDASGFQVQRTWCCFEGFTVHSLLVDPLFPNTIYAATYSALYRSTDGGASWSRLRGTPPSDRLNQLILDPKNSSSLYLATQDGVFTFTYPAPHLFATSGAMGQGAILHANTPQLADASNPARAGEILEVYCTGLDEGGSVPPQVMIGGVAAEVVYFGNTVGYRGLNQVNVRVPANTPTGSAIVVRMSDLGRVSNEVTIAVR